MIRLFPPQPARAMVQLAWGVAVLAAAPQGVTAQGGVAGGGSGRAADSVTALVGATVIDVARGGRLPDQVVEVLGDRIRAVVPRASWRRPPRTRVVEVKGRFIIPGLWDMHVEEALPLWDRAPVDSNAALFHPLFLAHGVTGVRDVAGDMAVLRRWRDAIERGERPGPRIVFTGPKVGMERVAPGAPFPVASRGDVDATVSALKSGGASAVYLYALPGPLLDRLATAAGRQGLSLEGNVPLTTTLRRQAQSGQRLVDHLDGVLLSSSTDESAVRRTLRMVEERPWWARAAWKVGLLQRPEYPTALALEHFSAARAESLFVQLAARRVYQVPTLRMLGVLNRSGDSAVRLPPPPLELRAPRRPWRGWPAEPVASSHPLARANARATWSVGAMHRLGVPILAGSDTPNLYAAPGLALHDELTLLVRAGLSPLEALRSATWQAAAYLGATDSLGTVAPGRVGDLLVLSGDPTLDIANTRRIEMVMSRGRLYDARALERWRAQGTAMAREVEVYWSQRTGDRW